MKKTKTGLHIETLKNRIEVYTEKELKEKAIKERQRTINISVMFVAFWLIAIFYILYNGLT
tara:strand:+ start:11295 stop:11477 length:183 start_codon:yes stop_codon:yes gene_type:complete